MSETIFYVGTEAEVSHHARPLRSCISNLKIACPEDVARTAKAGDLAIFYSEHFDRFRDLCVELKSKKIPTIYAIDGILEWRNAWDNRQDELACPWTMRPCLADVVASIGPRQTSVLRSWGNVDNVYTIGIPRLDPIGETVNSLKPQRSLAQAKSIKLLVVTAKCPGFTSGQIETTRRSILAIQKFVEEENVNGQYFWEVNWRLTGGLQQEVDADPSGKPIVQDILGADVVVSTASTAILESMLCGKPTVLLDFHQTPSYVPTVWTIHSAEQIRYVLNDVILQTETTPKRQFQQFLLQEALAADGSATLRLKKLIDATLRRSAECRDAATAWSFHNLPVDFVNAEFQLSRSFGTARPIIDENAALNRHQLEAYASQLKRENIRLNKLLDEAHQVFDHMQGHPVLGTILKTHKWFSEQIMKRPAATDKPSGMEGEE